MTQKRGGESARAGCAILLNAPVPVGVGSISRPRGWVRARA
jgi:hypothetical protein